MTRSQYIRVAISLRFSSLTVVLPPELNSMQNDGATDVGVLLPQLRPREEQRHSLRQSDAKFGRPRVILASSRKYVPGCTDSVVFQHPFQILSFYLLLPCSSDVTLVLENTRRGVRKATYGKVRRAGPTRSRKSPWKKRIKTGQAF